MGFLNKGRRARRSSSDHVDLVRGIFQMPATPKSKERTLFTVQLPMPSSDSSSDDKKSAPKTPIRPRITIQNDPEDEAYESDDSRESDAPSSSTPSQSSTAVAPSNHRPKHPQRRRQQPSRTPSSPRSSSTRSSRREAAQKRKEKQRVHKTVPRSATFPPPVPVQIPAHPSFVSSISSASSNHVLAVPPNLSVHPPNQFCYLNPAVSFAPQPQIPQYTHAQAQAQAQAQVQTPVPPLPSVTLHGPHEAPYASVKTKERGQNHDQSVPLHHPGPYAQELQRIQMGINEKLFSLSRYPNDPALKSSLKELQDQLNSTMDAAVAKPGNSAPPKGSPAVVENVPNSGGVEKSSSNQIVQEQNSGSIENNKQEPEPGPGPVPEGTENQCSGKSEVETVVRAEGIWRPNPHHHLCSGCGVLRSTEFHDKHSFKPEEKPKLNFCSVCREKKIKKGVAGNHHFCFRCGFVRSKTFHEEHPIRAGTSILENYCTPCFKELRADEDLPDISVVDTMSRTTSSSRGRDDESSLDDGHNARLSPLCRIGRARARLQSTEHGSGDRSGASQLSRNTLPTTPQRVSRAKAKRPRPLDLSRTVPLSPIQTPISSFLPSRNLGSFERRAERNSISPLGKEKTRSASSSDERANYRAPYVEDSGSAHPSGRSTVSSVPSFGRHATDEDAQTPRYVDCHAYYHTTDGNVDGRPPSSSCPRQPRESDRGSLASHHRDRSSDSDETVQSRGDSAKSSSSKTVRFKSSTEVHTSRSNSFCDEAASEIHEAELKPSNTARPTRVGNYGASPPTSERKWPVSSFADLFNGDRENSRPRRGKSPMDPPQPSLSEARPSPFSTPGDPPPSFSGGAFSKAFGIGSYQWGSVEHQGESCNRDASSFSGYDFGCEDYARGPRSSSPNYGNGGFGNRFEDVPKPSPGLRSSRGAFGAYFDESRTKRSPSRFSNFRTPRPKSSSPSGYYNGETDKNHWEGYGVHRSRDRQGVRSSPVHADVPFEANVAFTDPDCYTSYGNESFFQSETDVPKKNPYYEPRRRRTSPFQGAFQPSHSMPCRQDDQIPEPIIEEAESICSSVKRPVKMLEYKNSNDIHVSQIEEDSSSTGTEGGESAPGSEEMTSSDDDGCGRENRAALLEEEEKTE